MKLKLLVILTILFLSFYLKLSFSKENSQSKQISLITIYNQNKKIIENQNKTFNELDAIKREIKKIKNRF